MNSNTKIAVSTLVYALVAFAITQAGWVLFDQWSLWFTWKDRLELYNGLVRLTAFAFFSLSLAFTIYKTTKNHVGQKTSFPTERDKEQNNTELKSAEADGNLGEKVLVAMFLVASAVLIGLALSGVI